MAGNTERHTAVRKASINPAYRYIKNPENEKWINAKNKEDIIMAFTSPYPLYSLRIMPRKKNSSQRAGTTQHASIGCIAGTPSVGTIEAVGTEIPKNLNITYLNRSCPEKNSRDANTMKTPWLILMGDISIDVESLLCLS
jgi:hypothetical protein